eukprot:m.24046 g.24046  ORF g.24046 m.24046 type:complete len:566 (+) comp7570_c0_seq1:461-2158(+)
MMEESNPPGARERRVSPGPLQYPTDNELISTRRPSLPTTPLHTYLISPRLLKQYDSLDIDHSSLSEDDSQKEQQTPLQPAPRPRQINPVDLSSIPTAHPDNHFDANLYIKQHLWSPPDEAALDLSVDKFLKYFGALSPNPSGKHSQEFCLSVLAECRYNPIHAQRVIQSTPTAAGDGRQLHFDRLPMDTVLQFEAAYLKHGKNFFQIAKEMKTYSRAQCVDFYYRWKRTRRADKLRVGPPVSDVYQTLVSAQRNGDFEDLLELQRAEQDKQMELQQVAKANRKRKAANPTSSRKRAKKAPSVSSSSEEWDSDAARPEEGVFIVHAILADRKRKGKSTEYKVRWEGYPIEEATWEPEENLVNNVLLGAFKKKRREAARKSKEAKEAAKAASSSKPDTSQAKPPRQNMKQSENVKPPTPQPPPSPNKVTSNSGKQPFIAKPPPSIPPIPHRITPTTTITAPSRQSNLDAFVVRSPKNQEEITNNDNNDDLSLRLRQQLVQREQDYMQKLEDVRIKQQMLQSLNKDKEKREQETQKRDLLNMLSSTTPSGWGPGSSAYGVKRPDTSIH